MELHRSEVSLVELGIQPAGDITSVGHCGAHPNQLEAVLAARLSAPGLPLLVGQLGQQQLQYVAPVIVSDLPSQNMHILAGTVLKPLPGSCHAAITACIDCNERAAWMPDVVHNPRADCNEVALGTSKVCER